MTLLFHEHWLLNRKLVSLWKEERRVLTRLQMLHSDERTIMTTHNVSAKTLGTSFCWIAETPAQSSLLPTEWSLRCHSCTRYAIPTYPQGSQ